MVITEYVEADAFVVIGGLLGQAGPGALRAFVPDVT